MAEEAKMLETQPMVEVPRLSPFERIQTFLNEKGEIGAQTTSGTSNQGKELRYTGPYRYFITNLSFRPLGGYFGYELLKNYVDISISQKQPESTDSPPADIEITLAYRGQRKLDSPRGELPPAKQTSRIIVVNPSSKRREKAIITTHDPLGRLFNLSKKQWQEVKDDSSSYFVTSSEQEAEKIVDVLVNMKEEKARIGKITPEPLVSRRGFLRTLGVGAKLAALDTVLSHIPIGSGLSRAFWEQLETATLGVPTEELKKEIEKRFGVEIVGPSNGVLDISRVRTIDWDAPKLKGLLHTLAVLPENFYAPQKRKDGDKKLRFALVDIPIIDLEKGDLSLSKIRSFFCACSLDDSAPTVVLEKKMIGQTIFESRDSQETMIHELTHFVTSDKFERYIQVIGKPIGVENMQILRQVFASEFTVKEKVKEPQRTTDKPWWTEEYIEVEAGGYVSREMLERLNQDIEFFKTGNEGEVYQMKKIPGGFVAKPSFDAHGEEYFQDKPQSEDDRIRLENMGQIEKVEHKSKLGYGANDFKEFFSVAAEYYFNGKHTFVRTYEPFLGREKAEKLYYGVKQEIFRGIEY